MQISYADISAITGDRPGKYDIVCPECAPHRRSAANRKRPVCRVWQGDGFATWHCVRCGLKGYAHAGGASRRPDPAFLAGASAEAERRDADEAAERRRIALHLWDSSHPADGTVVDSYLRSRGINLDRFPATIRYLPASPPRYPHPAMIAAFGIPTEPEPGIMAMPREAVVGVHLTYLKPDGSGKADVTPDKKMVGRTTGFPIVVAPPNGDLDDALAVGEGVESALALHIDLGAAWAAASAGRMPRLVERWPLHAKSATIFVEDDPAGSSGARKLAHLLRDRGVDVIEVEGCPLTPDPNDILQQEGPGAIRARLEAARKKNEAAEEANRIARTALEIFELEIVSALELLRRPAPRRQWAVEPWIPHREVTLLSGDGGIGKSTIALQLCTSAAARLDWFGMEVRHGPALYISCEDDIDEVHYRLEQIKAQTPDAHFGQLHIVSLAGEPAFLATPAPAGMQPTARFKAIEKAIERHEIRLLVLDAAADVFGGNEIDRAQTRGFIQLLRGLAIRRDCAVILLAHPSVDAMKTGRGYAGSTAWNNSVRARLYFTRATAPDGSEPDQDLRLLELAKSNRGRAGQKIIMRWHEGCFVLDGAHETGLDRLHKELQAEAVFLDLLDAYNDRSRNVSDKSGSNFAPKVFSEDPAAAGIPNGQFRDAMNRLFTASKIMIETSGPQSRQLRRIVRFAA